MTKIECPPGYKYDSKLKTCVPTNSKRIMRFKNYPFYGRPSMNGNKKTNGNGNGSGNGNGNGNGGGNGSGGNGGGNGSGGNGGGSGGN